MAVIDVVTAEGGEPPTPFDPDRLASFRVPTQASRLQRAESMILPQEIVDEVIDNLAFDFSTLQSTSLVQKSWTHRSRRRLFYFVPINSLSLLEKWSRCISPDPNGIASYPRSILLSLNGTPKSWLEPENLDRFHGHFCSFSGVERLVIAGLETAKFDAFSTPRYFGNFAATVRSLELRTPIGPPASLLSFISSFPLVDDLGIEYPSTVTAGGVSQEEFIQPVAAPSFTGKLRLLDILRESYLFVELLCTLPLSFDTISVSSRDWEGLPQLAKLTSKCGRTLRTLHITRKTRAILLGPTGASLSSCVALEELRVTVIYPSQLVTVLRDVLLTLPNTTNLSRIVLDADGQYPDEEDVDMMTWGSLDVIMSEYAEKIHGKHRNRRLTLQFRTDEEGATGEHDGWARRFVGLLVFFPKVGNVEYISKH
ncbi:hypothetical protein BJ322DRAFT_889284 [Thelephora terrestris]|uniref:Uncharacterized protein n=1 Tax=Thelephora terrestris TaxID=56493 RepID=A0A9P6HC82_9AGAM|nr:hypothetical protein BJ322DRAFT_889284 [Thelephora terrestris]